MPLNQISSAAFGVHVLDEATGRGVPLVELETVDHVLFVTDSAGWAAISDPGLMNSDVFFFVRSHGYNIPKDIFGYSGMTLRVRPGGREQIKMRRINIAERICRLTGQGIYADSMMLGERVPLREPVLSGKVIGQDSALAVKYQGKMRWFWGDTSRSKYPLGNFRTSGAIATFPKGRNDAREGLDFQYFTDAEGFARELCPSSKPGPVWIFGVTVLTVDGRERLIAHYSRMKDLGTRLEHGYVVWDDAAEVFRIAKELPPGEEWRFLDGHPITLNQNGTEYLYSGISFPVVRVPASFPKILDPSAFEAFTCLTKQGDVRRDNRGEVQYEWQKELGFITPKQEADLVKRGKLRPNETRFLPRDAMGNDIIAHGGSVTYNAFRKKWILIATQSFGKESFLGEIYYSEAESSVGPWRRAVKILTHDRYTFYNPVHHPFLDTDSGRLIYFEGTYTAEFSGNQRPTPKYDYNQSLYRLDLADARLKFARDG
jgi:hypothetical protein